MNNVDCLDPSRIQLDADTDIWVVSSIFKLSGGGSLNITIYFTTDDVDNGNIVITPNSFKMDLTVLDYPWKQQNSSLALEAFVVSKGFRKIKGESRDDPDDDNVPVNKEGVEISSHVNSVKHGFFNWESNVYQNMEMSGDVYKVKVSKQYNQNNQTSIDIEKDETIGTIYFTLANKPSNYIYWDPYIGVEDSSDPGATPPLLSPTLVIVVIAVVVVIVIVIISIVVWKKSQKKKTFQHV
eukprot:TRINITY_DN5039_c0_g1_i2.p1 TRINITY_DN5039_c0_g1~~TRINITY_DN5039_c0_g1_i2.p1  ORF type:complete len:239 (-),score=47.85 TRINITY_DN5039_c0_g1_i2:26-742(-)